MSPQPQPADARPLAASIRSQAVWALIAAITLLYFGFTFKPADEDSTALQILIWTLKCGGVAMVLSALLLATGTTVALLADGVFSMLIGLGLGLAAALWLSETRSLELRVILEFVFGYLFFTSGLRSFRAFTRLGAPPDTEDAGTARPASQPGPASQSRPAHPPAEAFGTKSPADVQTPAPEGYLASFADKDDDNPS